MVVSLERRRKFPITGVPVFSPAFSPQADIHPSAVAEARGENRLFRYEHAVFLFPTAQQDGTCLPETIVQTKTDDKLRL